MSRKPKSYPELEKLKHLLGTVPDHVIAEQAGTSASIVGRFRRRHGIPAYDGYKFGAGGVRKGEKAEASPDAAKAEAAPKAEATAPKADAAAPAQDTGYPRRKRSKIAPYHDMLGKVPDAEIADLAGVSREAVRMYRSRHGIRSQVAQEAAAAKKRKSRARGRKSAATKATAAKAPKVEAPKAEAPKAEAPKAEAPKVEAPKVETPEAPKAETAEAVPARRRSKLLPFLDQLGKVPDVEIAAMAGVTAENVRAYRRRHNIPKTWKAEAPAASAPVEGEAQGFAVRVAGESTEYFVVAADIVEAAQKARELLAKRKAGARVVAVTHLGPALV